MYKHEFFFHPAIPFLGTYSKEIVEQMQRSYKDYYQEIIPYIPIEIILYKPME